MLEPAQSLNLIMLHNVGVNHLLLDRTDRAKICKYIDYMASIVIGCNLESDMSHTSACRQHIIHLQPDLQMDRVVLVMQV